MAYIIRKSFTFEAAHQLEPGCFTKACSNSIHGHSYTVELLLKASTLDPTEMVVDFGELKEFTEMIRDSWDHGLILHDSKKKHYAPLIRKRVLKKSKVTFLPDNPTAEAMARILFGQLKEYVECRDQWRHVEVYAVRVHETSNGWAQYDEGE